MQITCPGHADLHIETRYGAILCDPWRSGLRLMAQVLLSTASY
jgi:L-ascorbate metabolism protein UlaG (beta-lactamase superfamily)